MNREIKFRAWSEIGMRSWEDIRPGYLLMDVDRLNLMQYTGLKDKNGKEIYEGDIIIGQNIAGAMQVHWQNYRMQWQLTTGLYLWEVEKPEVIGNIHETPELLKEKAT